MCRMLELVRPRYLFDSVTFVLLFPSHKAWNANARTNKIGRNITLLSTKHNLLRVLRIVYPRNTKHQACILPTFVGWMAASLRPWGMSLLTKEEENIRLLSARYDSESPMFALTFVSSDTSQDWRQAHFHRRTDEKNRRVMIEASKFQKTNSLLIQKQIIRLFRQRCPPRQQRTSICIYRQWRWGAILQPADHLSRYRNHWSQQSRCSRNLHGVFRWSWSTHMSIGYPYSKGLLTSHKNRIDVAECGIRISTYISWSAIDTVQLQRSSRRSSFVWKLANLYRRLFLHPLYSFLLSHRLGRLPI
jgi:hypothetical protein